MFYAITFVSFIAAHCQVHEVITPDLHFTEIKNLDDLTQAVHKRNSSNDSVEEHDIFALVNIKSSENTTNNILTSDNMKNGEEIGDLYKASEKDRCAKKGFEVLDIINETAKAPRIDKENRDPDIALVNIYSTSILTNDHTNVQETKTNSGEPFKIDLLLNNIHANKSERRSPNPIPLSDIFIRRPDKPIRVAQNPTHIQDIYNYRSNEPMPMVQSRLDHNVAKDPQAEELNHKKTVMFRRINESESEKVDITFDEIQQLEKTTKKESYNENTVKSVTDVIINVPKEIDNVESNQEVNLESVKALLRSGLGRNDESNVDTTKRTVQESKYIKTNYYTDDPKLTMVDNPPHLFKETMRNLKFAKPVVKNLNLDLLKAEELEHFLRPSTSLNFTKATFTGVPITKLLKMFRSEFTDLSSSFAHRNLTSGVVGFIKNSVRNIGDLVTRNFR